MKIKCKYCNKKATHRRTVDIDIKGIPLCDDKKCYYKLLIELNYEKSSKI